MMRKVHYEIIWNKLNWKMIQLRQKLISFAMKSSLKYIKCVWNEKKNRWKSFSFTVDSFLWKNCKNIWIIELCDDQGLWKEYFWLFYKKCVTVLILMLKYSEIIFNIWCSWKIKSSTSVFHTVETLLCKALARVFNEKSMLSVFIYFCITSFDDFILFFFCQIW